MACSDHDVSSILKSLFGLNYTDEDHNDTKCVLQQSESSYNETSENLTAKKDIGKDIYAYALPWIIIIGLLGNIISLRVFTSQQLRKLSASLYLIALSASDSVVLLTYVLLDWLYKGLPQWPGGHRIAVININGVCQCFLFLSYAFRFVSIYLIVIFTVERYIAVCKPLQRRRICTKSFARRTILVVFVSGAVISIFKPLLSGVYTLSSHDRKTLGRGRNLGLLDIENSDNDYAHNNLTSVTSHNDIGAVQSANTPLLATGYCSRNLEYDEVNFIMELVYGISITAVPFTIISIFNLMIFRSLVKGDSASHCLKAQKNKIRLELTVMLLAISTSFILLNMPYFVVWVQQFLQSIRPDDPSTAHKIRSSLYITKTIFSLNYAINFFVYCMTGTYYRNVVVRMLRCAPLPLPVTQFSSGSASSRHFRSSSSPSSNAFNRNYTEMR